MGLPIPHNPITRQPHHCWHVDWNNTGSCFIHWWIMIQRPVLAERYNATLVYPMLEWPLSQDSSLVSFPVKCEYQYVPFYCNIIKFFLYIKMCVAARLSGLLPLWMSYHWYRLYCTWHHIPQHWMFHILQAVWQVSIFFIIYTCCQSRWDQNISVILWSRVLLEKLTVPQVVKIFFTFYEIQKSLTVFIKYKTQVSVLHECERPHSEPIWLAIL